MRTKPMRRAHGRKGWSWKNLQWQFALPVIEKL
jgi:hypothetical protein